jgi:hypothetical protein
VADDDEELPDATFSESTVPLVNNDVAVADQEGIEDVNFLESIVSLAEEVSVDDVLESTVPLVNNDVAAVDQEGIEVLESILSLAEEVSVEESFVMFVEEAVDLSPSKLSSSENGSRASPNIQTEASASILCKRKADEDISGTVKIQAVERLTLEEDEKGKLDFVEKIQRLTTPLLPKKPRMKKRNNSVVDLWTVDATIPVVDNIISPL